MRFRVVAITIFVAAALAAGRAARAQALSPRDIWPQAAAAALDRDFETAEKRTTDLLGTGRMYGVRTFPLYAAAAAGLASESAAKEPELAKWAAATANELDARSAAVAFSEADRAARANDYATAARLSVLGLTRAAGDYRRAVLARADLVLVGSIALAIAAAVFSIALFVRYGRSMSHDFRELLSLRLSGGTVSVLAFALLFLPLFLWLGPMWLFFYWFVIFFGYAGVTERTAICLLLVLVAAAPIAVDWTASRVAGVDSPVLAAAISSAERSYQPDALRRLEELSAIVPDNPVLHVLVGNLQTFEGLDDQANVHYRRAVELRPQYAGAHVNLGNLLFLNNEFPAAITEYEKAARADPDLAIAFYNHSVAAGETYKFDMQAKMLDRARQADKAVVERLRKTPPSQKIVMYHPPLEEAWTVAREASRVPAARALFGNYATFELAKTAPNPVTLGALISLLAALALWSLRRRSGFANACIKCGRTFCSRCKSARESTTYCTQCIHIYLKRDGVSLDTKRKKLEEVGDHAVSVLRRNRIFASFLPGSAQLLEGRVAIGLPGIFLFALLVTTAVLVGRLAPALGPSAEFTQTLVRSGSLVLALMVWLVMSLPVYRRGMAG